ncbi:CRTAC1 family protein [Sungkyunkwania multivorans]|uniref:CRTAC1 family protein n=1 Tax=Sungkyunkwania multivorans TaxID=1173618 RepID=A0ABW3D325_9FLAO
MIRQLFAVLAALIALGCNKERPLFSDLSNEDTGISFVNQLTETKDLSILDYLYFYNGGGIAIGDINNDDLPDIFFSGNQVKNKLYINKGNLQFEDATAQAGVAGNSSWNTGAVMGDVNGDGHLDIYVCAVVGLKGFGGHNELYINNGDGTFTESASKYGLDFDSYSSNAAFLDYDLDGDLDIYLLNHAVHTQESFGKAELRYKRSYETGDKLLRNDGNTFVDVSEEANILGGINGYGLGVAIADFNLDGYPDIYVGNDFHEDDYFYLNNGDGTFSETLKDHFGHTSRFSMGNDIADINGDGRTDLISLDMLAEDEKVLKASEGDDNIQTQKMRIQQFGYHYQFTRNMLYINNASGDFEEVALMSGVAATDWSWSALFSDYDQDGKQDLFIANGIPKRPNDLDYIKFASNEQIRQKINNTKLVDKKALQLMPSGNVHNYIFKGKEDLKFQDLSGLWIKKDTVVSTSAALADLDNDGDIDIVTNNLNSSPIIYANNTNDASNYLKLKLRYKEGNSLGIGAKVYSYHENQLQYKELYTVRGFQASSEPIIHFGYGTAKKVDSLMIVWPDMTFQTLKNIPTNQTLTITPENTLPFNYESLQQGSPQRLFELTKNGLGIDFTHLEDNYTDFNRQKLIPYQASDRGPGIAIGDLNDDGKEDIFFGGSKRIPASVYLKTDSVFIKTKVDAFARDSIKEEVAVLISDFSGDGKNDLIIGSGGGDFYGTSKPLLDSYFTYADSTYVISEFPEMYQNASVLVKSDYDDDGDLDVFVGNHMVTGDFGKTPTSYLLINDKGKFAAQNISPGMVTDAIWDDYDQDGDQDLIVVGEWMSPTFYENKKGVLSKVSVGNKSKEGLWQAIHPFDIDKDGDTDYLLGNWGENSKFKASRKSPLRMYYSDFDDNGQTETVVCAEKGGNYYAIQGLDELASQMVFLRKKFNSYQSFAGKTIEEILGKEKLKDATVLEVNELRSGYLRNDDGKFTFVPFSQELQVAPMMAFATYDFDKDGEIEALVGGNYFGVKPYHGRFDSFSGAMINNEKDVILGHELGLQLMHRSVRHLNVISMNEKDYLLVTLNNEKAQVYQLKK